ncbi:uroporphyrinogen-III C-methyltransferase [Alteromonas sp. ASW11-36]|uniref:Uroporphyrinogen-III C-methyltransferase n=1 Tax=Alteromonas arenosi TaxID=3055817 RepID=A0ABT7SSN4_9ALTE|nr:uroporphyrinogen-III C-methyltransferase [Alteromonas sp. ASW11-36]MDM7859209.1 uroporphyrinogen-III C-methyltransferase [Alteromonas sp. ASW11-36]
MADSDTSNTTSAMTTTSAADESKVIEAETSSRATQPKPKTGLLWFFITINLLLLIAVAGACGWYYWTKLRVDDGQQQQIQGALTTQQQALATAQSELTDVKNQLNNLAQTQRQTLQTNQQAMTDAQSTIAALTQRIELLQLELTEIGGRRPSDWLLAEADYLVRMAGRKLWLEGDDRSALMMLAAADARLADLADPSLIPIRQLLAEDMQTLRQLNPTSLTSVALAISGLIPQVDNLPIYTHFPEEYKPEPQELSESVGDWRENLSRSWDAFIEKFMRVESTTTPIKPFISEEGQWLARQQLKFALMQAKTAALSAEETLYQQSLQRAMALVVNDFDLETTDVQQFSHALQNLIETPVDKPFPAELRAQRALEDKLDTRINALFGKQEEAL